MHSPEKGTREAMKAIEFDTDPTRYRHWRIEIDGDVANLVMDVDPAGGLSSDYELKLNSYDLAVDIELNDAVQRLRFEHPEVRCVVIKSGKDNVFCAGANIRMLAKATHGHKVNFCKFTNETRLAIEDASANSGQRWLAAVSGSAAGGGYELAMAAEHIMLIDDRRSGVALPELPLLAVLPGTGGLTRLTDKRKVRRDRADVFCTTEEGVKGRRAVDWRLVDEVAPKTRLETVVAARSREFADGAPGSAQASAQGNAPGTQPDADSGRGIALTPLERNVSVDRRDYKYVSVAFDRTARLATIMLRGPDRGPPAAAEGMVAQGAAFWPLRLARELDDAILDIRLNEFDLAAIVFKSEGDPCTVLDYDSFLDLHGPHWLAREIRLKWKRVLKRIDLTSRSLVALIEPGSCFAGTLAEIVFAADRSYMLIGNPDGDNRRPAAIALGDINLGGALAMSNGLGRLDARFRGEPEANDKARNAIGEALDAAAAAALGLVTFALDDIDWRDEIRVFLEERASFSPDALTGLEANLRFGGPETMETKIFARLTAWQNWIFQRPNATGEAGALSRYGTGRKPEFDTRRA